MDKNSLKPLRPLLLLFVALSGFFLVGRNMLTNWGIDYEALLIGNLIVFSVILVSYLITYKGLNAANPNAFVRAMYGSFIIKFFVIAITAFIYIRITGNDVNKPALFACMGLYLVYTIIEVAVLLKLLKQKKNA